MKSRSNSPQGELNGFLDSGSRIQGDLHFEDTFRVDGHLVGKVSSVGDLIVGDKGKVEGEVQVGRVFVSGALHGTVRAEHRVEISAGGRVEADLDTPSLIIAEGAFFQGQCSMDRGAGSGRPSRPKVVTPLPAAPKR